MNTEQIQHLLNFLGYDTGGCDGIYGPKTRQAVWDFQEDFEGLAVDGIAGEETQKALRHAVAYGFQKKEEHTTAKSGDEWDEIEYFVREEFRCTCKGRYCDGFPVEPDMKMVRVLDFLRKNGVGPFTPNSAIRCPERNAEVGGASNSQHLYGLAADIPAKNKTPEELADLAETQLEGTGGIGIYSWGIHVDTRKDKARWRG